MRSDRGEFEEVFRSAYPSVLRTAFLVLRDRGRAEEVTQDGFVRLYERWAAAVRYDHPVAWVRKVVVRDAIRRAERERRQRPTLVLVDQGLADRLPDLDLLRAVGDLPPRQRAAVALFYLDDRPVDEVADLMAISAATVRQHLFMARSRLSEVLGSADRGVSSDAG
jgi:RNA polymerase sigma-70 factor (ECF subfamily)